MMPVLDRLAAVRRRIDAPPPPVVDVVIAVLCYLATVALPVKVFNAGGWPMLALAGLASLPLVWRRRAPVLVAAVVGVGTMGLALMGILRSVPLPYGQVVATYTVAALATPLWRLLVMGATVACTVLAVLALFDQRVSILALASLPFVVAYALGVGQRARRDRITMLEERAQRLAEAAEATAVRERERIAREIHDIVAHSVSLMVVQAEAGLVLATEPARAAGTFETISETGREALAQLDRALGVLRADGPGRHPQPNLDGLPDLVERARLAGLDAELSEDGDRRPVPADLAAAVYRVVQEAVTNTVRHAHARRLRARLVWRDTALAVTVADDGRGPVACGADSGRGLVGMRERVDAFGGELTTGPDAGGVGFRVAAVFPFDGGSHA
jgi:signal transduction histidine kinase